MFHSCGLLLKILLLNAFITVNQIGRSWACTVMWLTFVSPANSYACFWKTWLGFLLGSDIPMAQFIINLNASLPASQKFIIHVLDSTHMFVQPHAAEMIRSAISEFRDQNSYEKPTWISSFSTTKYLLYFYYFSFWI